MNFLIAVVATLVACTIGIPLIFAVTRALGFYTFVNERQCKVYMLFGKVLGVLDEPGLHILPAKLGFSAFLVTWLGKCHVFLLLACGRTVQSGRDQAIRPPREGA